MNDNATKPIALPDESGELQQQIKDLVIARILTLPEDVSLSVGDEDLKREQLIEHVQKEDKIGKDIVDMQMEFIRDMASGALYENQ
ncbi:hypothetical protein HY339_00950 [Candidatus Gottesmanbacteria bacterium]|nr:hypothetical protein [Candidatus Gottesmanbacteria bacterium]